MMIARVPAALTSNPSAPFLGYGTGTGMSGLPFGLFDAGTNYSAWTWKEWAVIGAAAWFFFLKRK